MDENSVTFVIMKVNFSKYEGAGNDFVVIDNRDGMFMPDVKLVAALCDRRFGIGADGLMLFENDARADFRMRYFNSDGGEATMCGNGGRCISLFAFHADVSSDRMRFVAVDGMHEAEVLSCDGDSGEVALRMTDAAMPCEAACGGLFVDTGSPHLIVAVDNVDRVDVDTEGRRLRNMPEFAAKGGVNVDFVERAGAGELKVRTYERGVEQETLACGTGAVAAAMASAVALAGGLHDGKSRCKVIMRGGVLYVDFTAAGGHLSDVVLTGPARRVFSGVFDTENF